MFQGHRFNSSFFAVAIAFTGVMNAQQIEPAAGIWETFVISSGKEFRVHPPPGEALTRLRTNSHGSKHGQPIPTWASTGRFSPFSPVCNTQATTSLGSNSYAAWLTKWLARARADGSDA